MRPHTTTGESVYVCVVPHYGWVVVPNDDVKCVCRGGPTHEVRASRPGPSRGTDKGGGGGLGRRSGSGTLSKKEGTVFVSGVCGDTLVSRPSTLITVLLSGAGRDGGRSPGTRDAETPKDKREPPETYESLVCLRPSDPLGLDGVTVSGHGDRASGRDVYLPSGTPGRRPCFKRNTMTPTGGTVSLPPTYPGTLRRGWETCGFSSRTLLSAIVSGTRARAVNHQPFSPRRLRLGVSGRGDG